ncbi:zf-DNL-domain-containing protein [Basidiobolus meristosporus CBS 931.73]|uniref:Zf-DNL-domain-containing protein n=1 Tax=Basidiobolus meristosporus CBS 931.73 TaxID=1314790 RepID=A0A1Y1Y6Y3_9FUNG|nr:zf-DNL-domain-containing protein [Basidiobolus meristosporus CBS 931.73]|eukprot:ORX93772.1 zf-DNL-domain-containing protein [Basidiobolus meristosporus CBS 931.73]
MFRLYTKATAVSFSRRFLSIPLKRSYLASPPPRPLYTLLNKAPFLQPASFFHHRSCLHEQAASNNGPDSEKPEPAIPGRLLIGFTCKVCNHRQYKFMSKMAYTKGVVLIQCDGCQNRHLIADNLGWFRDGGVNVEDLMKEQGEDIQKLTSNEGSGNGMLEWLPTVLAKEEAKLHEQAQLLKESEEQEALPADPAHDGPKGK